jgi:hypothetical protein
MRHKGSPGHALSKKPYNLILHEEERFAREAALAILVTRPAPVWRSLIPGMFLFDFLERGRMIRHVRRYYMPPRLAALAAAETRKEEGPADGINGASQEGHRDALGPMARLDPQAQKILSNLVALLADHYAALMDAGGKTFSELAKSAYGTEKAFYEKEEEIGRLESEWSAAVKEGKGFSPIPATHRQVLAARRKKRALELFRDV